MFRVLLIITFLVSAWPRVSFAAPTFANAVTNGTINIPSLDEASGIAASRNNPGVLWTENDSGNAAVVYAIDPQGRNLGAYALPGNKYPVYDYALFWANIRADAERRLTAYLAQ